jgi:hypothetical protein
VTSNITLEYVVYLCFLSIKCDQYVFGVIYSTGVKSGKQGFYGNTVLCVFMFLFDTYLYSCIYTSYFTLGNTIYVMLIINVSFYLCICQREKRWSDALNLDEVFP